jgi:hypothetical protein
MKTTRKRLSYILAILELQRTFVDYFAKEVLPYRRSNPLEYFIRLDALADSYEKTKNLRLEFPPINP